MVSPVVSELKFGHTLALAEVVELPPGWDHLRNVAAVGSNHGYFGNMRSQVQNKCMEAGTQPNGGSNSQNNPVPCKPKEHFYRLT